MLLRKNYYLNSAIMKYRNFRHIFKIYLFWRIKNKSIHLSYFIEIIFHIHSKCDENMFKFFNYETTVFVSFPFLILSGIFHKSFLKLFKHTYTLFQLYLCSGHLMTMHSAKLNGQI